MGVWYIHTVVVKAKLMLTDIHCLLYFIILHKKLLGVPD